MQWTKLVLTSIAVGWVLAIGFHLKGTDLAIVSTGIGITMGLSGVYSREDN